MVDRNSDITFIDFRSEKFEEIEDSNRLFEENVVENMMSGIESTISKTTTICLSQIQSKKFWHKVRLIMN